MCITSKVALIVGMSLALLANGAAGAGEMVTIRIYNDGADDIVVTVYDLNATSPGPALVNQRINGFAWIPMSVMAGADGDGHIVWTASSGDETFHRCGRGDMDALGEDDSVRVIAGINCARTGRGY